MLLLGGRPQGRHTEQHDIFFGIGESLKSLVPEINKAWPEAKRNLHVDAWREVTSVNGHSIVVNERNIGGGVDKEHQLFFINLGGYRQGLFDELHFKILAVQKNKSLAVKQAKETNFYKETGFPGAPSHIDDHHGLDVDDIYNVNDILPPGQKEKYSLAITENAAAKEDAINLGYFKLSSFK
jgi:hypothetical protein